MAKKRKKRYVKLNFALPRAKAEKFQVYCKLNGTTTRRFLKKMVEEYLINEEKSLMQKPTHKNTKAAKEAAESQLTLF